MDVFFGILVAFAVFFAVVIFHELGHFLAARRVGVKVEEFGVGIPPRAAVITTDKKGCEYTFNYLPIGGFVRLKGEDELGPTASDADAFASKSYWAKSAVILAGVFFNFILAFVVFVGLFWHGVAPLAVNSKFETRSETLLVPSFDRAVELGVFETSGIAVAPAEGSPSKAAGIQEGDKVVGVEGHAVSTPKEFVAVVKSHSADADGIQLELLRNGVPVKISVMPKDGKIGSYVSYADLKPRKGFVYQYPLGEAVVVAAKETVSQTGFTFELLYEILRKLVAPKNAAERQEAAAGVGGPIAVGGLFVQLVSAKVGISVILTVAALLSINLGAFNLLPLPALDGGRFFIATLLAPLKGMKSAKIRKVEALIHQIGFSILIIIAVIVAFHDVWKLVFPK